MKKSFVFITGATSGIGAQCAHVFAQNGHDLVITGRRADKLESVKETCLKYGVKVTPLCFDISNRQDTLEILDKNRLILKNCNILINNAGGALGIEPIDQGDLDKWEQMIDTNIKGLLYVSRFFLPLFKDQNEGHIINLGSVAGRWVYPNGNVYCATKHAVRALSEGMRMDLCGTNIRVSNIEPGMVETEFSLVRLGDENAAKNVYQGMTPLEAADIAESIYWVSSRPKHVNIHEMVIYPTDQAHVTQVNRN